MALLNWLTHFAVIHDYLVYGLLIVASFVEGPILGLLCGLLFRFGYLDLVPAYIALMIGDLLGDVFWYSMGRFFGHRFIAKFGRYMSISEDSADIVRRVFHKYSDRILLISKLTAGFGFALVTLVTAGLVKIPFRRYLALNVVGQVIWTGMLMGIGYLFANLYATFDDVFSRIFLIAGLVILCAAFIGFGRYIRTRFSRATFS